MAQTLFNRYIWLMDTIYRAKTISFEEINRKWLRANMSEGNPIPKRTFHNHRNAIDELFGIKITCDSTYHYSIENIDDIKNGGVRQWLINTFAVNNLINESHKLKERILFEDIPSGQRFLTPIIEAMRDGVTLQMTYHSFWKENQATFEFAPYFVKVFKQRWYVIGESDRLKVYALDRIKALETTSNPFELPKEIDPQAYFYSCYGIINDETIKPQTVVIKVDADQAKYFRALPLHSSQQEIEENEDYSVFQYYIKPLFDFRQELLSHGEDVEVISPDWFRDEIKSSVAAMQKLYSKKPFKK